MVYRQVTLPDFDNELERLALVFSACRDAFFAGYDGTIDDDGS